MEDVLQSSYYKYLLVYNNVDWFVDEVIKVKKKMNCCFKKTKKDIIMTEKNEEGYKNNDNCRFCKKK